MLQELALFHLSSPPSAPVHSFDTESFLSVILLLSHLSSDASFLHPLCLERVIFQDDAKNASDGSDDKDGEHSNGSGGGGGGDGHDLGGGDGHDLGGGGGVDNGDAGGAADDDSDDADDDRMKAIVY